METNIDTQLVWNRFSDQLYPYILKRVKTKEIAEDLMQEVFIKIHGNLEKLREQKKLGSWVYTITRNAINDHFRSSNPQSDINESNLESQEQIPSIHSFEECLMPFINCLPDHYKEALIFTEIQGYSQKEYAETYGLAYPTAKSRVQRAKQELKKLFVACCNPQTDVYGNVVSKDEVEGCPC